MRRSCNCRRGASVGAEWSHDMPKTRITAVVSNETKTQLERYADAHGLKKGAIVEEALLHYLLRELPADPIISPQIKK